MQSTLLWVKASAKCINVYVTGHKLISPPEVDLSWCYTVTIKCSLHFLSSVFMLSCFETLQT